MAAVGRMILRRRGEIADRFVIRAAGLAPSVYNTQPWYFTSSQGVIRLYADMDRKLTRQDPAGRELTIGCGAALCNLSLAMRHLGFAADVRLLPDLGRSGLLAEIRWGWYAPPTPYEDLLYRCIPLRRTHRGPFAAGVPPLLTGELVRIARQERAGLHVIYDTAQQEVLADLARAAERAQHASPATAAERARWTIRPGEARPDGVPPGPACGRWDGPEFACRGLPLAAAVSSAGSSPQDDRHAVGLVALLSTREDRRPGWLLAGQALQRLLLQATTHDVSAAFHTQLLEIPALRDQIRAQFTNGAYPQMLLRLGRDDPAAASPRRPVSDTLRKESA